MATRGSHLDQLFFQNTPLIPIPNRHYPGLSHPQPKRSLSPSSLFTNEFPLSRKKTLLAERCKKLGLTLHIDRLPPFHSDCLQGHVIKFLQALRSDSKPSLVEKNTASLTPLHCAVLGQSSVITEKLLSCLVPSQICLEDNEGRTALDYALIIGKNKISELIEKKSPDLQKRQLQNPQPRTRYIPMNDIFNGE